MTDEGYDLGYLKAGVPQLESYLLSQELYWPIGASPPDGMPPYPQLTLGSILLSLAKLSARALSPQERSEYARLRSELESTRTHWQVAWEQKARREFHARLMLWRDYIEDYRQNPTEHADRYTFEVSRRVMLDLLSQETRDLPHTELELLSGLDNVLQAKLPSGGFVWEDDLSTAFPSGKYWYLYRQP